MPDFALAHASDDAPEMLAERCAEQLKDSVGHNIGFLYVTSPIAGALGTISDILCEKTGVQTWIGTSGSGVCATGASYFGGPAVVILSARFDDDAYMLLPSLQDENDVTGSIPPNFVSGLGVVHGDPRNAKAAEIISELSKQSGAYLVGGITDAADGYPQIAGEVVDGGVSGCLLGGSLNISVGLTQGCSPIGPTHQVTRAAGNVIVTLDEIPALQVLIEDLGVADGVDPLPWLKDIHAALVIAGSDTGDYIVRNLMGIDPGQQMVVIAERISAGDRLMFVKRDAESADKDLQRMIADLKGRTAFEPKAGLYFSCCARGPNLFEDDSHEISAIQRAFGDIPIVGFFGNGEISHDRIYGYTGVLTLFG